MNRLILLALIGGGLYWLFKEPQPSRSRQRPDPDDEEALLDQALDESFPASDPPAVTPRRR